MRLKKQVILMFGASSPLGQRLAIDQEARAIQSEIDRASHRDQFELQIRLAVEALDLLDGLRRYKPSIVHFSGHGSPPATSATVARAARRDVGLPIHGNPPVGLCLPRPDGGIEFVSPDALRETFRAVGSSTRLAVVNTCSGEPQARALRSHVDCVIWMRGAILDDAAIHFAGGLYGGIVSGATIANAFKQGVAALRLKGLADRPQLLARPGIDPCTIILGPERPPRS